MLTKAVFPIAAFDKRFLPFTKSLPKEMLPVIDKPLIQYAVEEAVAAGFTELVFITNSGKRAVEEHFDSHLELEERLKNEGNFELLEVVRNILPKGITCVYLRQPELLGLGHAISLRAGGGRHSAFCRSFGRCFTAGKATGTNPSRHEENF